MFLFHNVFSQMAVKQGNQLQMQVHEGCRVVDEAQPPAVAVKQPVARTGKKPLGHYSSLVRVLGSDMKTSEETAAQVRWAVATVFLTLCLTVSGVRLELFIKDWELQ